MPEAALGLALLPLLLAPLPAASGSGESTVWMSGREVQVSAEPPAWDEKGYMIAFACQGRFGNQFDYLLGTLDYARAIDRTLILAPWVDYNARRGTGQYPWFPWFKEYFDVDALRQYHGGRVIDMPDFLHHFRDRWEEAGVTGFCAYRKPDDDTDGCMTYSVPKGPFWRNLNVSFAHIEGPPFNRRNVAAVRRVEHPVLCLDCSPGRYPAERGLDPLAQYLKWSPTITNPAQDFIDKNLRRPFVALHFRHAFASAGCGFSIRQCHDYGEELKDEQVCTPGVEEMRRHLQGVVAGMGGAESLFYASDKAFKPEVAAMFEEVVGAGRVKHLPTGLNEVEGHATPGQGAQLPAPHQSQRRELAARWGGGRRLAAAGSGDPDAGGPRDLALPVLLLQRGEAAARLPVGVRGQGLPLDLVLGRGGLGARGRRREGGALGWPRRNANTNTNR